MVGGGGVWPPPPFISSFTAFSTRRDREERASRAGVSHQRRVLKEDRRLQRPRGRFSFLAAARDPRSSSPTPQSVRERERQGSSKETFSSNFKTYEIKVVNL